MKELSENRYLSIAGYARTYGISRHTVYKWLEAGVLQTYRVDTLVRIKNVPPDEHQEKASS
jgi:excisionase family DNA binding protein